MNSTIVQFTPSQTDQGVEALSAAFSQDPILNYFLSADPSARLTALKQLSQALIRYSQDYNQIYTTAGEVKGVAVWLPPQENLSIVSQLWRSLTSGLIAVPFSMRWDRLGDILTFMLGEVTRRQQDVPQPHWYLMMLGVAPQFQGQGVGGALLQPILEKAERDGTPCYLETSTESAVRFYQRHGFEIAHTGTISADVPFWTMKRYPQK